ncbi:Protein NrfI [Dirofilaria immitis]
MSGEIFFNFDVKPVKKRKTQARENQMESTENKEENISLVEGRSEKKKHQNSKLDEGVWKRIDYAKANAIDTLGFYGGSKQNETEHSAIRRKPHSNMLEVEYLNNAY